MGVVVDWIDAYRARQLNALLDLYDAHAAVECCDGGHFEGREAVADYWRPRLAEAVPGAFEIAAVMPVMDSVSLDYRSYDGTQARTVFRFSSTGRISQTACEPIERAA